MKILVVTGSRDFVNQAEFDLCMDKFMADKYFDMIVAGGCKGTDLMAKSYAARKRYYYAEFPILSWEWEVYPRAAGPMRNERMVNLMQPNHCVAFLLQGAANKGTKNCANICAERDIDVTYFNVSNHET